MLTTLIAIAVQLEIEMNLIDFFTAYLNTELKKEIYMEIPNLNNTIQTHR